MFISFVGNARSMILLLFALGLFSLAGCEIGLTHDPDNTVTLEISQVKEQKDRDELEETLSDMLKGLMGMSTSSWSNETMTIKLSPVHDVKKFSRRINFGKVTELDVENRTIKVQFIK